MQPSTNNLEKPLLFVKLKFEVIVESSRISLLVVLSRELKPRVMKRLEILARRREERGQGRGVSRLRLRLGQSFTLKEHEHSFIASGITPELWSHWKG